MVHHGVMSQLLLKYSSPTCKATHRETPITSFSNKHNKPGSGTLIAPTCQSCEQNNPRFWTVVTNRYLVVLVSHWTNLTYGSPRMATFSLAGKSWKSIKQVIFCSGPSTKHHLPNEFHKDSTDINQPNSRWLLSPQKNRWLNRSMDSRRSIEGKRCCNRSIPRPRWFLRFLPWRNWGFEWFWCKWM